MEQDGEIFLFDLTTAPGEQTNLASTNPQLVEELKMDFQSWERDVTGRAK
jgi:hypothetical protein